MTAARPDVTENAVKRGFETSDVPARGVAYAILGLFAGIAVSAAFVAAVLALQEQEGGPISPLASERQAPPPPRLEVSPSTDRATIEAAAQRKLHGYAWTDRAADRVRIPIERAMRITAERGWPDQDRAKAPSQ